jgi:hypothetical protein
VLPVDMDWLIDSRGRPLRPRSGRVGYTPLTRVHHVASKARDVLILERYSRRDPDCDGPLDPFMTIPSLRLCSRPWVSVHIAHSLRFPVIITFGYLLSLAYPGWDSVVQPHPL